jgi:NADH dehydrogenase
VVIIGGGFGGLYAAQALAAAPVRVLVIDRRNHHVFQPLLYQVATATLSPSDIAQPIRSILRFQKNCEVVLAEVTAIDRGKRQVVLADERIDFDFLIVATGAIHSYFGHDQWAQYAPGLKTLEDAIEMRRRVLCAFEAAERQTQPEQQRALLTFVVIGGGPTGVELAGALAELSRIALARDFRHIDPALARIVLLQGGPRILPTYPAELSTSALTQLRELGVEVRLDAIVTSIDASGANVGDTRIDSQTVIWCAGVKASPLAASLGVALRKDGRVDVTSQLTLPGDDRVFVIGDLAAIESNGQLVPGVAAAAIQMGRHAARAIRKSLASEVQSVFHYQDKGSLATIGRSRAIAIFPPQFQLRGAVAWWAWLLIHVALLIGFRNRVVVLVQWAWAYFTFRRGARLITGSSSKPGPPTQ